MKQHIEKYLPCYAFKLSEHEWYYLKAKGLLLVHEVFDRNRNYVQTDQTLISWPKVTAALEHYEAARKKQAKAAKRNPKPTTP